MCHEHNNLALVRIMGDIVYSHNVLNYNTGGLSNIHARYYEHKSNSFFFKKRSISMANDPI